MSNTNTSVLLRAQRLLKSEPALVPLHVRERIRKALEIASSNPEYASKLLDVWA